MSKSEGLDMGVQSEFDHYYGMAVDFNADIWPFDVTREADMLLHAGRLLIGASVGRYPAIYQDAYTFRAAKRDRTLSVVRTTINKIDDDLTVQQWNVTKLPWDGILASQEMPDCSAPKLLGGQAKMKQIKSIYGLIGLASEKDAQIRRNSTR